MELESAELRFNTDAAGQPTTVTVKQVRLASARSPMGCRAVRGMPDGRSGGSSLPMHLRACTG